jgi:hypothetical protein
MEFRRFFKRGLLFAAPVMAWVLAMVVVDPFDYFDVSHAFPEPAKIANAAAVNSLVFNMLKEVHHPCENLIIGDSRAESLPLERIEKITGQRYFLLSANALKLNESLDLFYFANRTRPVKRAVFTLNFNEYNEYAYADRVTSVESMIHNPLIYLFDRSVAQAAYYVAKASLTRQNVVNSVPPMTPAEFWNYIVSVRGREHYERFRHPDGLQKRIQELASFAKTNGIEVTFIIVPHQEEFQRRVREFGLNDEYLRFKREMSQLGVRVIDYDFVSALTLDKANFRDPLHYNEATGNLIADEVFRGPLVKGKLLDAAWANECSQFLF